LKSERHAQGARCFVGSAGSQQEPAKKGMHRGTARCGGGFGCGRIVGFGQVSAFAETGQTSLDPFSHVLVGGINRLDFAQGDQSQLFVTRTVDPFVADRLVLPRGQARVPSVGHRDAQSFVGSNRESGFLAGETCEGGRHEIANWNDRGFALAVGQRQRWGQHLPIRRCSNQRAGDGTGRGLRTEIRPAMSGQKASIGNPQVVDRCAVRRFCRAGNFPSGKTGGAEKGGQEFELAGEGFAVVAQQCQLHHLADRLGKQVGVAGLAGDDRTAAHRIDRYRAVLAGHALAEKAFDFSRGLRRLGPGNRFRPACAQKGRKKYEDNH